jgi:hypothetical protein
MKNLVLAQLRVLYPLGAYMAPLQSGRYFLRDEKKEKKEI